MTKSVALTGATDPGTLTTVPADGTITGWRVMATFGAGATVQLRIFRPAGAGQFKGAGTSSAATVFDGITENATSLPVKAGDLIGFNLNATGAAGIGVSQQTSGGTVSIWDSPGLADGATSIPTTSANVGLVALNATLSFGGATTTTLSVATKGNTVKAKGSVDPFAPGLELKLTLFRKKNGKFRKVDTAHPALNTTGHYSTQFARANSGKCKLTASFSGDSDFAKSSASKKFSC